MSVAAFVEALGELADVLLRGMPAPRAEGSHQGNVRATGIHRDVKPENVTRGLVPCSTCNTPQRPGAVHFAKATDMRPCVGSWGRR